MKIDLKRTFILAAAACLLGFSGISLAVEFTGSCPAGHHVIEHGSAHVMGGGARDALAKDADDHGSNCHGRDGISASDDTPNLAGQNPMYLCAWLDDCRKRGEKCEGHEDIAAKFTDQQIIDLSEYYANLPSQQNGGHTHGKH